MQREIKFRCWDDVNKRFHYWGYDIFPNFPKGIFTGPVNPYFLSSQYTNHKIDNKELYDGDIIRNEKFTDDLDDVEYLVCAFISEWAMFGLLTIEEYRNYLKEGADCLDEFLFWTFPIVDKENEQRRICGDIYSTPWLLKSL